MRSLLSVRSINLEAARYRACASRVASRLSLRVASRLSLDVASTPPHEEGNTRLGNRDCTVKLRGPSLRERTFKKQDPTLRSTRMNSRWFGLVLGGLVAASATVASAQDIVVRSR